MSDEMSEARARIEQIRAQRGETSGTSQQKPGASEETRGQARQDGEMSEARARIEQIRAQRNKAETSQQEEEAPQQEEGGTQGAGGQTTASSPDSRSGVLETVRNNPVTAAIAGVIGLLALRRLLGRRRSSKRDGKS